MDLTLTPAQLELQARARAFVHDVLQPREAEFEAANGRVPREWGAPIRRAADRGPAPRRLVPRGPGRAGLVGAGPGAGPRAARPEHRRPVVVHPGAVQRADPLRRRAARPLPRPVDARRAVGELRDHRGRRRLGRPGAAGDGRPRRRHRRVRAQRREVVRDRARRHRLHDLPRQRGRRRPATADAVPRGLRRRPACASSTTRTTCTPSPTGIRSSCSRTSACRPAAILGGVGAGRRADERVVRRGADPHRRPLHRRDGAAADAGRRVGHGADPVRGADLRLPGRHRSRWPIRPPTPRRPGCSRASARGSSTAAPMPRSSTPRRRWPSCSPRRRRSAAPTGWSRSSAAAATCASTRPSGSSASCGSTGSGRARRRSSG